MLWNPAQLLFGALEICPKILVGLSFDGAMPGGIRPVQCGVAERRCQRVGRDNDADDGCGRCLRPHPVAKRGKEEERDQRFQAIGRRAGRTVDDPIQLGFSELVAKSPIHRGRHGE